MTENEKEVLEFTWQKARDYKYALEWLGTHCNCANKKLFQTRNGMVEVLQEIVDKETPRKPDCYNDYYFCANCGDELNGEDRKCCCSTCGQQQDWSEYERLG